MPCMATENIPSCIVTWLLGLIKMYLCMYGEVLAHKTFAPLFLPLTREIKTRPAEISRRYHWFLLEMTSEEWVQKFHTDYVPLPRSGYCFRLIEANLTRNTTQICQIWAMTSIECLRLFFESHFTGHPVLASRKVGCFLTLWLGFYAFSLYSFPFLIGLPREFLGGLFW